MRISDNYDRWEQHQAEQDRAEEKLPECSECGKKIYDDFCYEFEGEPICDECMYEHHRKNVEYFM